MSAARKFEGLLTEDDVVRKVSEVIMEITGVQLGTKQRALVLGRLAKRIRELNLKDMQAYAGYLAEHETAEIEALTSLLTTHHTYFFREFSHFEFLLSHTLPNLIKSHRAKGQNTIRIWSAACSRGQEVYSLAMFLKTHMPTLAPDMKFEIMGSDVDGESVQTAKNGVYGWDELKSVPATYMQGNWLRGTGEIAKFVRAKDELRKNLSFQVVNLLDSLKALPKGVSYDIIFCRNVFIYFTPAQIQSIIGDFAKVLSAGGTLFIGLSESLNGLNLPMVWAGPSVYTLAQKPAQPQPGVASPRGQAPSAGHPNSRPNPAAPAVALKNYQQPPAAAPVKLALLRVLCVDDSPTVLLLLKKILVADKGFEVVGTAADGEEAGRKAQELKPDVITLDIHMPKVTGVQFLERFQKSLKIPVVMVSSVSREESSLAFKCMELGASDYVEKPSMQNLKEIEEELHMKLRTAFENRAKSTSKMDLDSSFKTTSQLKNPQNKIRVIVAAFSARERVLEFLQTLSALQQPQPPVLVLFDGGRDVLGSWTDKLGLNVHGFKAFKSLSPKELAPGSVAFGPLETGLAEFNGLTGKKVSVLTLGTLPPSFVKNLTSLGRAHLTVEELEAAPAAVVLARAEQIVPSTSMIYESDKYFASGDGK